MELGFTVSAGPLSQISVHLLSLETAVQLATGLWGWYKGPQSVQSLQQTLDARNAALVPSQTFLRHRYTNFRNEHGCVYGAAFDTRHTLIQLALPRASTALSDDAGIDCLRALIVGLSCFLVEEQIYAVLKDLIPEYLLHFQHDDDAHRLEGASLTATLHFITAVMGEEVVDKIRGRLFDVVDSQLPRVSGASRNELLACQHAEIRHIAGVLRWVLKPAYRFEGSCKPAYPTRSLKVWALALVLAELGFEVEASRIAVKAPYDSRGLEALSNQAHLSNPELFLVLAHGWPTDVDASDPSLTMDRAPIQSPARLVPIRAIPSLAFAEFATKITVSVIHLQEAFNASFQHVQDYFRQQRWIGYGTGLAARANRDKPTCEVHTHTDVASSLEDIVAIWTDLRGSQLGMSDAMLRVKGHPRLLLKPLIAKFGAVEGRMDQEAVIQIMLLAWLLAVVTLFVRHAGVDDPLDFDFAYQSPFTRMLLLPERIQPVQILEPTRVNLRYTALYQRVQQAFGLLSDLYTYCHVANKDPPRLQSFRNFWHTMIVSNLTVSGSRDSAETGLGIAYGVQYNGLTIVSDFILNPSFRLPSALIYHIQRGQLLDLPLQGNRIVSGSPSRPRGLKLNATDVTVRSKSDVWAHPEAVDWLRWDAEPCWESDVRTCSFTYRVGGIPRFQLGIEELFTGIRTLGLNHVTCSGHSRHKTNEDHWEILFNPSLDGLPSTLSESDLRAICKQKWLQLPIIDMVRQGQLDIADVQHAPGSLTYVNWLVHVGENDMLAMLALISRFCRYLGPRHRIMTDCLAAGLEHATKLGYPADTVMIIVRKESSSK